MPVSKAVLEDLFETKLPPKAAAEDISLRDEKLGLGFPGERFDLACPECGAVLKLRNSKHGLFYGCEKYPACKASHGAYDDGRPKGTPGNKETRKARIYAHRVFDRLWKAKQGEKPKMTRSAAYAWLRKSMKLSESEAHIGNFSVEQCSQLVVLIRKKFPGVRTAWDMLDADDDSKFGAPDMHEMRRTGTISIESNRGKAMNDPKNKTVLADGTEVRLNGKRTCPNCGDEKDMGEFGARRMEPGGGITNQSWCRTCRNPPKTGS